MHSSNIDEQLGRVAVDRESAVQRLRKLVRLREECADEVAEVELDGDSGQNDRIDEGEHRGSTTKVEKISFSENILLIKSKYDQTNHPERAEICWRFCISAFPLVAAIVHDQEGHSRQYCTDHN